MTFIPAQRAKIGLYFPVAALALSALIGLAACAPTAPAGPPPAAAAAVPVAAPAPGQQSFATPLQAVQALVAATRANDRQKLLAIFGADGARLIDSGDPVADRKGRTRFVAAYALHHSIEEEGKTRATLVVGPQQWPFPIPLIRHAGGWYFDTGAGEQEILDRRIGRNERHVIEVCRVFVEAENEYADQHRLGFGRHQYAQRFISRPGTRDGLYWPSAASEPESPLGPLMAHARAEGYGTAKGAPYHGYFYKILKAQGTNAPGGARNYVTGRRMTGGFALVAFPAQYGDSGVMTFIVNQDGIVYQKDLGPDSAARARGMTSFDPDQSWQIVP